MKNDKLDFLFSLPDDELAQLLAKKGESGHYEEKTPEGLICEISWHKEKRNGKKVIIVNETIRTN